MVFRGALDCATTPLGAAQVATVKGEVGLPGDRDPLIPIICCNIGMPHDELSFGFVLPSLNIFMPARGRCDDVIRDKSVCIYINTLTQELERGAPRACKSVRFLGIGFAALSHHALGSGPVR